MRKCLIAGLSALMILGSAINVYADQSTRWTGSGDRWQVSDNAGGYLKNTWFQDDVTGHWYLLGAGDGSVMYAGLVTDQSTGKTYLMNTNHDGTFGRMISTNGVYNINGKNVQLTFNQNHDGTFGAITSGLSEARSTGVTEKSLASIPTADNTSQTNENGEKTWNDMTEQEIRDKYFGGGIGSGTGSKVDVTGGGQTSSGDYVSGSYEDARNRMAGASGDSSEQRAVKWE